MSHRERTCLGVATDVSTTGQSAAYSIRLVTQAIALCWRAVVLPPYLTGEAPGRAVMVSNGERVCRRSGRIMVDVARWSAVRHWTGRWSIVEGQEKQMGWWANMFRRRQWQSTRVARVAAGAVDFADGFLTLGDLHHWFGPAVASPDGQWILSWIDADLSGGRGGAKETGMGGYLLYDARKGTVALKGRLERPNNGHVANNGTFVLEDWHLSSTLSGTFVAFDAQGRRLLNRCLGANLMGNGVSVSGQFAVCQTASSGHADSPNPSRSAIGFPGGVRF